MPKTSYRELAENFIKSKSEKDYKVLHDKIKPGEIYQPKDWDSRLFKIWRGAAALATGPFADWA